MPLLHPINLFLGSGTILVQILIVVAIALLVFGRGENRFISFLKKNFLLLGFLLSLIATVFSLYYSEIVGFLPCKWCWIQRIFMYPQVFLFGVALWKKDERIGRYALPLLLIGVAASLYHNYIYNFTPYAAPCDASGVSCVQRMILEFGGYTSIPMMALTAFGSLLTLLAVAHFYKKEI